MYICGNIYQLLLKTDKIFLGSLNGRNTSQKENYCKVVCVSDLFAGR